MIVGYIRVSTEKQTVQNQKHEILDYANRYNLGKVDFIEVQMSSTKSDFEQNGHWIIIDRFSTLENTIRGANFELPSIDDGLLDHLEAVNSQNGVLELTFVLNNEFSISLLILEGNVPKLYRSTFEEYFAA